MMASGSLGTIRQFHGSQSIEILRVFILEILKFNDSLARWYLFLLNWKQTHLRRIKKIFPATNCVVSCDIVSCLSREWWCNGLVCSVTKDSAPCNIRSWPQSDDSSLLTPYWLLRSNPVLWLAETLMRPGAVEHTRLGTLNRPFNNTQYAKPRGR